MASIVITASSSGCPISPRRPASTSMVLVPIRFALKRSTHNVADKETIKGPSAAIQASSKPIDGSSVNQWAPSSSPGDLPTQSSEFRFCSSLSGP
jgi:hypothetical protein